MNKLIICGLVACAACHKEEPAEPTAQQSAQLNEAENMLDVEAANEEGPADRSTGPSNSSE